MIVAKDCCVEILLELSQGCFGHDCLGCIKY